MTIIYEYCMSKLISVLKYYVKRFVSFTCGKLITFIIKIMKSKNMVSYSTGEPTFL